MAGHGNGDLVETVGGYECLARLMSEHPDNTIFRKFRALSSKMLMYRQAELLYDEEELNFAAECHEKDSEKKCFNHSWQVTRGNSKAAEFRKTVDEVQGRLKSYYDLLVVTAEVEKLAPPNTMSLAFLREWVKHRDRGPGFLLDIEAQAWHSSHGDDFVVISPKATHDSLAVALNALIMPFYHRYIGNRRPPMAEERYGQVWNYSFDRFVLLAKIISVLLATVAPAGSIVILYVVSKMWLRLLIIAIFCFLFACVMTFVVGARRIDVFSATAAFAAVQAVFVGGTTLVQLSG